MTIPGIWSQRDSRWSGAELGFNTDPAFNIYHYGCLVTAIANMLWYNGNAADPGAVNQWLKGNGGFVSGGGIMIWTALQPLLDQVHMVQRGYSSDLNAVNAFLQDDNNFAIAEINKAGFPQHFSVMPFVNKIADSWDGVLKDVTTYRFVGAHLYSKLVDTPPTPAPAPEPVPPVAPQPTPPQPPVVVPDPTPIEDPTPAPTPPEPSPSEPSLPPETSNPTTPPTETPQTGSKQPKNDFIGTILLFFEWILNKLKGK